MNFETKSILSDGALVNLESSGIFGGCFSWFWFNKTYEKPLIPSDNLGPASIGGTTQ